jgi:hypothetical protein
MLALALAIPGFGQSVAMTGAGEKVVDLPDFETTTPRVAIEEPANSIDTPISMLRFEPLVDLQSRNFAEAQGDITIRGGIFEGTAVQLGGVNVFDPQTGHYAAELPVPPAMISAPMIAVGADHAMDGFNGNAGTVRYDWRPVESRGLVSAGIGSGNLQRASAYFGQIVSPGDSRKPRLAFDLETAHSKADGTIANGDHEFHRYAGRVQLISGESTTNLFAGYQSKFFGWPNLYTPFGVAETENLQTTLIVLGHRSPFADGLFEASGYFRRNNDDYEFDRFSPGLFDPFQHETQVFGGFAKLSMPVGLWQLTFRGDLASDSIESTTLGNHTRWYGRFAASAGRDFENGESVVEMRFGGVFDYTNRDASAVSPVAEVAWVPNRAAQNSTRWYAQISESTRVPGYTALYSSPTGGLFRGANTLGRESAINYEVGVSRKAADWDLKGAVFFRDDDPMVDWTYSYSAPNARSANEVRVQTAGVEFLASRSLEKFDIFGSYTWLTKDADYGQASVDASFYALNFAEHRLTFAITARLGGGFEIRNDNEFRIQEENPLRTVGGDEALLSALGLFWNVPRIEGLELSLVADNLWDSDFQEIPAVTAAGRQVTGSATYRW